jgi:hypothetical protein
LDFDGGVKRVNREHLKTVETVQVKSWADIASVLQEDLSDYQTIVVDTIGKMMDFIVTHKCGIRQPKIQDWGSINAEFSGLVRNLRSLDKNIIFVAHRDTRREGDDTVFIPALREKSYNSIVTELDLLGYMEARSENGRVKCTVTFDPTNRNDGKNTCSLPTVMEVPTILDAKGNGIAKNTFIADCVINPYLSMLKLKKEETDRYNVVIAQIKDAIELITDARSANDFVSSIKEFEHTGSSLEMARSLLAAKASNLSLVYNKKSKSYEPAS